MELSRCKVCGYIMETSHIKDDCPACGLPAKVFEPYKLTISEERYKWISLHMHPIILHFPQAFVVTGLGLIVLAMIFTGQLQQDIMTVVKFNLFFLPFTVAAGALSGAKDGQLRFKKITTPALKFKIKLSVAFFVLSVIDAALVMILPTNFVNLAILFVITAAASGIAVVLGKAGAKLMDCTIPGK